MSESIIQEINQSLVGLTDHLYDLNKLYGSIKPLITAEHQAISQGDIDTVEGHLKTKNKLISDINQQTTAIGSNLSKLGNLLSQQDLLTGTISLGSCLVSLQEKGVFFVENFRDANGLPLKHAEIEIFKQLVGQYALQYQQFKSVSNEVQPLIETHYLVVQKGLRNLQQSYRFWQNLAREADATYDAKGKQNHQELSSLLRVKA